jgi:hypothetical protein
MVRYTALVAAARIRRARGIELVEVIETGQGSGILLSRRPSTPHILGFGAVDAFGESVALALSEEEAIRLRDALTDWVGV